MASRACGFVFCYNEDHILRDCLLHYLNQGIDLVVVDNCSTDRSTDIANSIREENSKYPGKICDVVSVETDGFEWQKILRFACDYMHRRLSDYEWILLIDADAFYHSPVEGLPLLDFLEAVRKNGYNILDGALYDFYPTEKDDPAIASPVERMKYCAVHQPYPQHKIFLYHPSIDFYTHFGHVCIRDDPRVCSVQFPYLHYRYVSYQHGLKKIFSERNPRFVERRWHSRYHPQYLGLLPRKEDLVKRSYKLWHFQEKKVLMSRARFQMMMSASPFIDACLRLWRPVRRDWFNRMREASKSFMTVFHFDRRLAIRLATTGVAEKCAGWFSAEPGDGGRTEEQTAEKQTAEKQTAEKRTDPGLRFFSKRLPSNNFWTISPAEWIEQKPYANGLPQNYHFLMTDFCNASCIFCDQDFMSTRQISIENFRGMVSHIPSTRGSHFTFSGGGEPLLCRDLFRIIKYVNEEFPWVLITIKCNGLLVGKFAEQLASSKITRLGMSVHGATRESNNAVLRANNERIDVFDGIRALNEQLLRYRNPMRKIFYIVVSKVNIDEVPALVQRAAELKVDEVMVVFSKQFPAEVYESQRVPPARPEDSMFYHQEKYNEVIRKSAKLAKSLGVGFRHEPLFFEKFKEQPCFQPWHTIVVNWDGQIFPCTGGEVWFRKPVKEGEYYFGNLLREPLTDFWNNDSYTKIRRTTSRHTNEGFVSECHNCHNTCCFKGPNLKQAHILELNSNRKREILHTIKLQ